MIAAAIFLAPHFAQPIMAAAWGVFIGGILQLAFQVPFLKKLRLLPRPKISWRDEGVRKALKLMAPALIGVSVAQIGLIIDMLFASFLPSGSLGWLNYSNRLAGFPLGVFGVAIATVVLPHLSRKHTTNSLQEYSKSLDWALRCVLLIAIPSAIGILILSGPITATFLGHGKFNAFDVTMATRSLVAFSVGLPSFMLVKVLAIGFYSRQDIKTPVKIAVIAVLANIVCNCILIFPLAHAGLALATSLSSSLNAGCLWLLLRKNLFYIPQPHWLKFLFQLCSATTAMAIVLWFSSANMTQWMQWGSLARIWHLALILLLAGLVFLACLFISGVRYKDFKTQALN
jgi:putative peptidoglycan lipid II flippase